MAQKEAPRCPIAADITGRSSASPAPAVVISPRPSGALGAYWDALVGTRNQGVAGGGRSTFDVGARRLAVSALAAAVE